MRIPIFEGERHLGFVRDEGTLRRYAKGSNVEIVRRRGVPLRINVTAVLDAPDQARGIGPNSVRPTYEDELPTGPLTTLKRVNEWGELERWPANEGFAPGRFNPDAIQSTHVVALR